MVRFFLPMKLIRFASTCNAYLLILDSKEALLFDCPVPERSIISALDKEGATLKAIFLTHGHYDHIYHLGDPFFQNVPIYMGEEDFSYLSDPYLNLSKDWDIPLSFPDISPIRLCDGESLELGTTVLPLATPFHTSGSFCFYLPHEGILFSGDTLFRLSVGRTDLPGAKPRLMGSSLEKLKKLPEQTIVYPGHEKKTTIAFEKANNPFLQ